ncbi:hypothetical protein O181_034686 [Austropuccinia psidii MF-1]|uniref:Uncharacterized protein n=1 Tax=Austropuccinia psidii MF-1 TaxID=1389203 RepID=A0A9Q3D175_9BASI|nr:hypothetical protein [Austropuccinia psidii MF-1]
MSFHNNPFPSSLRFKNETPSFSPSKHQTDDVMVTTKPYSVYHQSGLKDDESNIPTPDVMFRPKPIIEHHEVDNADSNYKMKLNQSRGNNIHD